MSRPIGSKNKPKIADVIQPVQPVDTLVQPVDTSIQPVDTLVQPVQPTVIEVKQKTRKMKGLATHPEWVLTETMYGTPIAIIGILKNSKCCDLVVIPHYESKTYQTTVNSLSVFKPEFATEEIAKSYEGVKFYVHPLSPNDAPVMETVVQSPETVNESPNTVTSPDTTLENTTPNAGVQV